MLYISHFKDLEGEELNLGNFGESEGNFATQRQHFHHSSMAQKMKFLLISQIYKSLFEILLVLISPSQETAIPLQLQLSKLKGFEAIDI